MGNQYRSDRRADKVPAAHRVTKNEATETTDLKRLTTYELERERLNAEIRRKNSGRSFADLVRKK